MRDPHIYYPESGWWGKWFLAALIMGTAICLIIEISGCAEATIKEVNEVKINAKAQRCLRGMEQAMRLMKPFSIAGSTLILKSRLQGEGGDIEWTVSSQDQTKVNEALQIWQKVEYECWTLDGGPLP